MSAEPLTFGPFCICPNCHIVLDANDDAFAQYFHFEKAPCARCGKDLDLWKVLNEWVHEGFSGDAGYELVGASRTVHRFDIQRDAGTLLDLTAWGVPPDATVLSLNFTAVAATPESKPARPIFLHGNAVAPFLGTKLYVYGATYGNTGTQLVTQIMVSATWTPPREDDTSARHLIDAATQYSARRYDGVVVPANIAVESALTPAVFDGVSAFCSRDRAKRFLQDGATYSDQLNVLTPMICRMSDAPNLPSHIRGSLNRLRGLRNEIAHEGRPKAPLTQADAADLLAAAVFGYRYARFLRNAVKEAKESGSYPHGPDDAG